MTLEPSTKAPTPDGSLTPIIDIVFQLLVFFLLTMNVREAEGRLLNRIPKELGTGPGLDLLRSEIRIMLCSADENDSQYHQRIRRHMADKRGHEADLERQERRELRRTGARGHPAHLILNDVCTVFVDRNPMGRLFQTWVCPRRHVEERNLGSRQRAAKNTARYRQIAGKTANLYATIPSSGRSSRRPPIAIDADSAVPYEHIIGVVNALKEVGIENVEFAANPRISER